jgi:hypothetical protein
MAMNKWTNSISIASILPTYCVAGRAVANVDTSCQSCKPDLHTSDSMTYGDASQLALDYQLRKRISQIGGDLASSLRLQIRSGAWPSCCFVGDRAGLWLWYLLHSRAFVILAIEAVAFTARGSSQCLRDKYECDHDSCTL